MTVYYNENNEFAADWLEALIKHKYIADGEVDRRSIDDVTPNDLSGFTQHHFFAGIGGWSYALRLAGWPDDKPVWTGSCPCQPFSASGKGIGFDDPRHMWPSWYWLIAKCNPATIFGEQVASKSGRTWFDLVRTDLERSSYAAASSDLCAASVGAPHARPRQYWVAHSNRVQQRREEPRRRSPRRMGRVIQPVSWDRDWASALREFRSVDDGLSYGVGITDGFRNAIVPTLAKAFIQSAI